MKTLLLFFLILFASSLYAQSTLVGAGQVTPTSERARWFKTYTNFTAISDDTTGYVTINNLGWIGDPLLCSRVYLIGLGTDSVAADVYVIADNKSQPTIAVTYADSVVASDSLSGGLNTGVKKVITLKSSTIDRLAGCTEFKVGTVFRAIGQGTTTGRTFKWYIMWIFP